MSGYPETLIILCKDKALRNKEIIDKVRIVSSPCMRQIVKKSSRSPADEKIVEKERTFTYLKFNARGDERILSVLTASRAPLISL